MILDLIVERMDKFAVIHGRYPDKVEAGAQEYDAITKELNQFMYSPGLGLVYTIIGVPVVSSQIPGVSLHSNGFIESFFILRNPDTDSFSAAPMSPPPPPQCGCGAHSVNSRKHADYCDLEDGM